MTDDAPAATPRWSLPNRWWVPALGSFLLAVAFVLVLLVKADGDASLLVHAAPPATDRATAPASLTVQDPEDAFDGQFFYRLGVDPWSTETTVSGVTYDLPSLRNARWGYGALAWVASGGDEARVPEALILVNLLAAAVLGAAGGALAKTTGRHAVWGLLFVLWPGFAYSLSLDTSELVASAFVLLGLLAGRHRRWAATALALSAAVLTRDTTAVVPFGFAVAAVATWWSARRVRSASADTEATGAGLGDAGPGDAGPHAGELQALDRVEADVVSTDDPADAPHPTTALLGLALAGGLPLLVFGIWQLVQRARFDALPLTSSGDNNLSAPLAGLVRLLLDAATNPGGETMFRLVFAVGIVAAIGLAAWCLRRTASPLAERAAWVPAVLVVVVLNSYLWSGATAFMRAATEAGVLSTAIVLAVPTSRRLPARLLAIGSAAGWLLTAAVQVTKLG